MIKYWHVILFVLAIFFSACQSSDQKVETVTEEASILPRSTPEAQGVSSGTIINLLNKIEESGLEFHSLMIVRNDHVIAEGWWDPYGPEYIHTLYSLSKSFTSTAIGFAVQEGLITVNDKVVSFFPEDLPDSMDQTISDMEIRHLLTMSTGHEVGTMPGMFADPDGNWPRGFFAQKLTYEPGEQFMYNTGATYMLSAIIQKTTGEKMLDYLKPRLFDPLNIEGMDWEEDPKGVNVGGYGLRVKTEDIAKLGLLYLHKGKWNGEQILSEAWVEEATKYQIKNNDGDSDWSQGYGYQFWRCKPENVYRGDGAFGQYCIVDPNLNLVIAITSESKDMQASMDLLWDYLLPEIKNDSLPSDPESEEELRSALSQLALSTSNLAKNIPDSLDGRTYILDQNELGLNAIKLDLSNQKLLLMGTDTLDHTFGWNDWKLNDTRSNMPLGADVESYMSISAGWDAENNFILRRQFVEMAHHDRFVFNVSEGKISWNESVSLWTPQNKGRVVILKESF